MHYELATLLRNSFFPYFKFPTKKKLQVSVETLVNALLNPKTSKQARYNFLNQLRHKILNAPMGDNDLLNLISHLQQGIESQDIQIQRDCCYLLGEMYLGNKDSENNIIYPNQLKQTPRIAEAKHYLEKGMELGDHRCSITLFYAFFEGRGCVHRNYDALNDFCENTLEDQLHSLQLKASLASYYSACLMGLNPHNGTPSQSIATNFDKAKAILENARDVDNDEIRQGIQFLLNKAYELEEQQRTKAPRGGLS